jgi:RNA polymerase sigma-70 factor (ECF subfamily)
MAPRLRHRHIPSGGPELIGGVQVGWRGYAAAVSETVTACSVRDQQVPDVDLPLEDYRGELLTHCYRMLGSFQDAEDLVQETMLRAWGAADRYDPTRASLRTWLHRIATNACLTALEGLTRRPLPAGLVGASEDPQAAMVAHQEVPWLQPFPDTRGPDPAEAVVARETTRLAFAAALQLLPPRQRAVLLLRDVLRWPASDVAEALDTSVAAVNSALQRARAGLASAGSGGPTVLEPDDRARRDLLDRYVEAFLAADVSALARLLTDDAVLEMPPVLLWYVGRDHYAAFMHRVFALRGSRWRTVPVAANGQIAFAAYADDGAGGYAAHSLQVLTVSGDRISHNVVFADPALFALFDLPATLP